MALPPPEEYAKEMARRRKERDARQRKLEDQVSQLYDNRDMAGLLTSESALKGLLLSHSKMLGRAIRDLQESAEDLTEPAEAISQIPGILARMEKLATQVAEVDGALERIGQIAQIAAAKEPDLSGMSKAIDALGQKVLSMVAAKSDMPTESMVRTPSGTSRITIKSRDNNGDIKTLDVVHGVPVKH